MKADYEGKENMSVQLLSNRKEERGSHMDDLTPPDFVGPSAANPPQPPDGPSRFCRIISQLQCKPAEGRMTLNESVGLNMSNKREAQLPHLKDSAKP